MGYTAAAIIYHLDEFNAILENPRSNNMLVQACKLYTNNDFVLVALKCMAWFTLKVMLPFLNMCELQKQSDLLCHTAIVKTGLGITENEHPC